MAAPPPVAAAAAAAADDDVVDDDDDVEEKEEEEHQIPGPFPAATAAAAAVEQVQELEKPAEAEATQEEEETKPEPEGKDAAAAEPVLPPSLLTMTVENPAEGEGPTIVRCLGVDRRGQLAKLTASLSSFGLDVVSAFIRSDLEGNSFDDMQGPVAFLALPPHYYSSTFSSAQLWQPPYTVLSPPL